MIVINMYIAIILENFNQAHQEEEIGIVEEDLEMFYTKWAKWVPILYLIDLHYIYSIHYKPNIEGIKSFDYWFLSCIGMTLTQLNSSASVLCQILLQA